MKISASIPQQNILRPIFKMELNSTFIGSSIADFVQFSDAKCRISIF